MTYLPLTFMVIGFAIVAGNAWMIGNKRHRALSARGLGLYALGIFCLSAPLAFVLPLFAPARAVVKLVPATAGGAPVLVAETTSMLPPWMGAKRLYRLAVVDPVAGRRITRASLGAVAPTAAPPARLVAVAPDRLWYDGERGLELRDPGTAKVIVNKKRLVELYPQLAAGPAGEVTTSDGHVFKTERGGDKITMVKAPPVVLPDEPAAAQATFVPDGNAVTRKALDGKLVWSVPLPGPPTAVALLSGTVWVGAGGRLYGLDPATGARKHELGL